MTHYRLPPIDDQADTNLLVITTGGTIDSHAYDPLNTPKRVTPNNPSIIAEKIKKLGGEMAGIECMEWMHADSNDITQTQLIELLEKVKAAPQNRILITHGTDTMVRNARFFQEALKGTRKTVLFVGAMQPILNGPESDGIPNLEFALDQIGPLSRQSPGVHIVGRAAGVEGGYRPGLFDPATTQKDHVAKIFTQTADISQGIMK